MTRLHRNEGDVERGIHASWLVVAILIPAVVLSPLLQDATAFPQSSPSVLLRQTITLGSGSTTEVDFQVPGGLEGSVKGAITATGGAGNDVRVWVLTEAQRKAWRPGVASEVLYDSKQQHEITIDLDIFEPGHYFFLLDNTFSVFSAKRVAADVQLSLFPGGSRRSPCQIAVVLSIGDLKGLAHIGALDALKENGITPDCVFGNSMGALIGSVYTVSPAGDLRTRYRELMAEYVRLSEQQAGRQAGLLGLTAAVLSGGALAILGAAAVGGAMVEKINPDRFRLAMNNYYASARIERVALPYATSYQYKSENGLDLKIAASGSLAEAVSRSINNPFIFQNTTFDYLDPGSDRSSAVPVEDACNHFKPQKIIAINVTGKPVFVSKQMSCEYVEITIDPGRDIPRDAMLGVGTEFDRIYAVGYDATKSAMGQ